jgi:hypothetical protein
MSRADRTKIEDNPLARVGYTAAGAAGAAVVGVILTREGWEPKSAAGLLAAAGGAASWASEDARIQCLGAGAMSAAGGQLALLLLDEREQDGRRNAGRVSHAALREHFRRVREQLGLRVAERNDDAGPNA